MKIELISAGTVHPNTPESDMQKMVLHEVKYLEDGEKKTIKILATDPGDALSYARTILKKT